MAFGSMHLRASLVRTLVVAGALVACTRPAAGQSGAATAQPPSVPGTPATAAPATPSPSPEDPRIWEVEVHVAVTQPFDRRSGSGTLPTSGALVQGLLSASTLYFGDASRLFNDNPARGSAPAIVPLDTVLQGAPIERSRSLALGGRLDRRFTDRLGLEITGEYRRGRQSFRSDALAGIEAARASVKSALDGVLSRFAVPSTIASQAVIADDQNATQVVATGALVVNLTDSGRARPYLVAGGGVMLNRATSPRVVLEGSYDVGSPAQLLNRDAVAISVREKDRAFVALGGAGVKYRMSPRWGIRLDGRANFFKNTRVNIVDVQPIALLQSTGQPFPVVTAGTLQFSPLAPLSGSPIVSAPAFTGSGFHVHVVLSSGVYLRF